MSRNEHEIIQLVSPFQCKRDELRKTQHLDSRLLEIRPYGELHVLRRRRRAPDSQIKDSRIIKMLIFKACPLDALLLTPLMPDHNRNPKGRNQHGETAKLEDPGVKDFLIDCHRQRMTSNNGIANNMRLKGWKISGGTVKRWRAELGLSSSSTITNTHSLQEQEQIVLKHVDANAGGHHGPRTIMQKCAWDDLVHIPCTVVEDVMRSYKPEGFFACAPDADKVLRVELHLIGKHERWSSDGHDKLNGIDGSLYSIVDYATGKRLGQWIVPNNREGDVVAYLYLSLVIEYGGIPIQTVSDCGSETTMMFGLQNALMETFHPNETNVAAHSYVKSTNNIAVKCLWRTLGLDWGYSAVKVYMDGIDNGDYDPDYQKQRELARWLWPKILQRSLNAACAFRNSAKRRKDKKKTSGPNGVSHDDAFDHPEKWGGHDCLLPVDREVVKAIRDKICADGSILDFISKEFAEGAEAAFVQLGVQEATPQNSWHIFKGLFSILYPA